MVYIRGLTVYLFTFGKRRPYVSWKYIIWLITLAYLTIYALMFVHLYITWNIFVSSIKIIGGFVKLTQGEAFLKERVCP